MRLIPALLLVPAIASAEPRGGQLQFDGGLSVIGAGYEHPLASHLSVQAEAFVFGTYFLPWFDLGEDTEGFGAGVRATWFVRETGHGPYITPYLRGMYLDDASLTDPSGGGYTTGVFVGWAFGLSTKLDLRIGAGVQYIRAHVVTDDGRKSFDTPFLALDATLGYRL